MIDETSSDETTFAETRDAILPAKVGVLGGGRMGSGIAHAFLLAGCQVVVVERDESSAEGARQRICESLEGSVLRGYAGDIARIQTSLTVNTAYEAFASCQLVIEAVPESLQLKEAALREIEAHIPKHTTIATNTSSISISALASSLEFPGRLIGLHFFNPVPSSTLIEVVTHDQIDPLLSDLARKWAILLGKTAVTVSDTPGFASSRLGIAIALEAIRMVEEGVASAEDIDLAMELGYKHPLGPLKTTDIVGLDVRLGIAEQLEQDLGPRFAPPKLLETMVAAGKLGRKSGQGFYHWNTDVPRQNGKSDTR